MVVQTAGGVDRESKERESTIKELKKPVKYLLPDSKGIELAEEKYLAPEILFYPDKIGHEFMGIQELVISSIKKADLDLKKDLYESIYLAGAASKFQGLATRILNELKEMKLDNVKIKIFTPNDREFSCWFGGSILTSLASFKSMWITKKEIEEQGPRVLHTKSF